MNARCSICGDAYSNWVCPECKADPVNKGWHEPPAVRSGRLSDVPDVRLKDQPRWREPGELDETGMSLPRPVRSNRHEQLAEVGVGRVWNPGEAYQRVARALQESGGRAPVAEVARIADCSVAYVRKVIAHLLA